MLSKLSIKNYAIIKDLTIDFQSGFSVITGETGAGKSILLGAISMLLGQRADSSILNIQGKKCVIEGTFVLSGKINLKPFFIANDLDYENSTVLRREITETGKTRAFINDTPVSLTTLRELGLQLVDIHSQHSNLDLNKHQFQLNVIDWYGDLTEQLADYQNLYKEFRLNISKYNVLKEKAEKEKADLDYFQFQYNQLKESNLAEDELSQLESEQEMLTHAEDIKNGLVTILQLFDNENTSVLLSLKDAVNICSKIKNYYSEAQQILDRINNSYLDLKDLASDLGTKAERIEFDPQRLENISQRLNLIYNLLQKHRVSTVSELIEIQKGLESKLEGITSSDKELYRLGKEIEKQRSLVEQKAKALTKRRCEQIPKIEKEILEYLDQLGMPNSAFNIHIEELEEPINTGIDSVTFLFSANKGIKAEEISKVASGGELSRLMLAVKSVIAKAKTLPTIIFDEIDTGISGDIASKMAKILLNMSQFLQVINITHLPQIASKGEHHFRVHKKDIEDHVETDVTLLEETARIDEIAKMLSGDHITDEARLNAISLLKK